MIRVGDGYKDDTGIWLFKFHQSNRDVDINPAAFPWATKHHTPDKFDSSGCITQPYVVCLSRHQYNIQPLQRTHLTPRKPAPDSDNQQPNETAPRGSDMKFIYFSKQACTQTRWLLQAFRKQHEEQLYMRTWSAN